MRKFNRKNLKGNRKHNRNNPTQAEAFLWGFLKGSKLEGRKFRRQTSIENFIVDFYCPEEELIVELDGDLHFDEDVKKYDERRTKKLEESGLTVLRFENQDVLYNPEAVLQKKKQHFKQN